MARIVILVRHGQVQDVIFDGPDKMSYVVLDGDVEGSLDDGVVKTPSPKVLCQRPFYHGEETFITPPLEAIPGTGVVNKTFELSINYHNK